MSISQYIQPLPGRCVHFADIAVGQTEYIGWLI
jgi:hypothetical protein